ncbi:hypothetical protein [Chondrinema litorale]|uniref:hypothetical protein n=1 Tax=Chondrinema litorale TaxID=2994555 RepID=UPI002542CC8A|nr:hypothetical protein [Chondrinema litorale]UZR99889.1 hypothetical protein OQ292_38970 [Chondrinema litorale]
MKKITILSILVAMLSICFSCEMDEIDDIEKKDTNLGQIGFKGSILNANFGNVNVVANNELSASSIIDDGSYVSHTLSLRDNDSEIRILLSLPPVKFNNDFIDFTKVEGTVTTNAVKTYYPISLVKEKLAVGEKPILSSDTEDPTEAFRILVLDDQNITSYTTELGFDQTGSSFRVIDLQEDIENDADLGSIKTLIATFEVNIKLYKNDMPFEYAGDFTGILKMKFKDNI